MPDLDTLTDRQLLDLWRETMVEHAILWIRSRGQPELSPDRQAMARAELIVEGIEEELRRREVAVAWRDTPSRSPVSYAPSMN